MEMPLLRYLYFILGYECISEKNMMFVNNKNGLEKEEGGEREREKQRGEWGEERESSGTRVK